jgi:hypothetical protein
LRSSSMSVFDSLASTSIAFADDNMAAVFGFMP